MNVLLIGLGSVGIKHYDILNNLKSIKTIKVVSKQNKKGIIYIKKRDIKEYNPDYIIISNLTSQHYKTLKYIDKLFVNKVILVEKPLFHKYFNFNSKKNKIFVGYNMRFNPVINYLKNNSYKKRFNLININCGTNVKKWRKNINYHKSNTSKKIGGGALLELSHELDYLEFLFGKYEIKYSIKKKLSNLKIKNDDFYHLIGKTKLIKYINLKVNLFDNKEERLIKLSSNNNLIEADILNNKIKIFDKKKYHEKNFKRLDTLKLVHQNIISRKFKNICTLEEGKKILRIIEKFKV